MAAIMDAAATISNASAKRYVRTLAAANRPTELSAGERAISQATLDAYTREVVEAVGDDAAYVNVDAWPIDAVPIDVDGVERATKAWFLGDELPRTGEGEERRGAYFEALASRINRTTAVAERIDYRARPTLDRGRPIIAPSASALAAGATVPVELAARGKPARSDNTLASTRQFPYYFERQRSEGCGVHALNNVLGFSYVNRELDPTLNLNQACAASDALEERIVGLLAAQKLDALDPAGGQLQETLGGGTVFVRDTPGAPSTTTYVEQIFDDRGGLVAANVERLLAAHRVVLTRAGHHVAIRKLTLPMGGTSSIDDLQYDNVWVYMDSVLPYYIIVNARGLAVLVHDALLAARRGAEQRVGGGVHADSTLLQFIAFDLVRADVDGVADFVVISKAAAADAVADAVADALMADAATTVAAATAAAARTVAAAAFIQEYAALSPVEAPVAPREPLALPADDGAPRVQSEYARLSTLLVRGLTEEDGGATARKMAANASARRDVARQLELLAIQFGAAGTSRLARREADDLASANGVMLRAARTRPYVHTRAELDVLRAEPLLAAEHRRYWRAQFDAWSAEAAVVDGAVVGAAVALELVAAIGEAMTQAGGDADDLADALVGRLAVAFPDVPIALDDGADVAIALVMEAPALCDAIDPHLPPAIVALDRLADDMVFTREQLETLAERYVDAIVVERDVAKATRLLALLNATGVPATEQFMRRQPTRLVRMTGGTLDEAERVLARTLEPLIDDTNMQRRPHAADVRASWLQVVRADADAYTGLVYDACVRARTERIVSLFAATTIAENGEAGDAARAATIVALADAIRDTALARVAPSLAAPNPTSVHECARAFRALWTDAAVAAAFNTPLVAARAGLRQLNTQLHEADAPVVRAATYTMAGSERRTLVLRAWIDEAGDPWLDDGARSSTPGSAYEHSLYERKMRRTYRFEWWSADSNSVVGSTHASFAAGTSARTTPVTSEHTLSNVAANDGRYYCVVSLIDESVQVDGDGVLVARGRSATARARITRVCVRCLTSFGESENNDTACAWFFGDGTPATPSVPYAVPAAGMFVGRHSSTTRAPDMPPAAASALDSTRVPSTRTLWGVDFAGVLADAHTLQMRGRVADARDALLFYRRALLSPFPRDQATSPTYYEVGVRYIGIEI